jgi:hypothetical protein
MFSSKSNWDFFHKALQERDFMKHSFLQQKFIFKIITLNEISLQICYVGIVFNLMTRYNLCPFVSLEHKKLVYFDCLSKTQ